MRIFQMRDLGEIEAFVLAVDYGRASAIFEAHLIAHGGDPDAVLYREIELQHLDEPANDAVYVACTPTRIQALFFIHCNVGS